MKRRNITRVSIPSRWGGLYDTAKTGVAEFRIGAGPCGKVVTEITVEWAESPDRLTVCQHYSDGGSKDFIYMVKDLTGRVKVSYEALA